MDEIDRSLLRQIAALEAAFQGTTKRPIAAKVTEPFEKKYRTERLRYRLDRMEAGGLICQDRESMPGRVIVMLTDAGRSALA